MKNTREFLEYLRDQFQELKVSLIKIFQEEKSIKDNALLRRGFIIYSYSLNYNVIKLEALVKILNQLTQIINKEEVLQENLKKHLPELRKIEEDYATSTQKELHLNFLTRYLNDTIFYCKLMLERIQQLISLLKTETELLKKNLPTDIIKFFISIEEIGKKIIPFTVFLEQLTQRIIDFEANAYYPEPRTYGRILSKEEYKRTTREGRLSSRQSIVPVFAAQRSVREKLSVMSPEQLKTFFKKIGVIRIDHIIFFQTRSKPINADNPVRQKNGLQEYKFPTGSKIILIRE